MSTFTQILNKFRLESTSERDKGARFEMLMQTYLKTTTLYATTFEDVWLWDKFEYRDQFGGKDVGIDLVAKGYDNSYWAIQCKCYDESSYISKGDVDSFLSTSSKTFDVNGEEIAFSNRLWISTTNHWNATAELTIKNQSPKVTRLNLIDLDSDAVDWGSLEKGIFGKASRPKPFEVKPHQETAIEQTHAYLQKNDRGKLIMACGTGKTFTSLKIAEREAPNGLVLFLVPSIALLGQTLRSWSQQADKPLNAVCICSDGKVSKQTTKNDDDSTSIIDLALPASTDIKHIAKQLLDIRRIKEEGMTVVFSTYQSIEVISKAQELLLEITEEEYGVFDLIICDEAHRTTGVTLKDEIESSFVMVHDNDFIQSKKRIYMTATPRLYTEETKKKADMNYATLCSMDDKSIYGDEIYRIGFGEAVERQLLTDYKVLILAVGEKDITPSLQRALTTEDGTIETDDASKFVGCINALSKKVLGDEGMIKDSDPMPMRRAVAFCQNIKKSKETSFIFTHCKEEYLRDLDKDERESMVDVVSHHVDGTMSATTRDAELMWLKDTPDNDNECRILSNARCLSEGVDVPSLDAVVFVSAKNSQVDVVQSVGRVMRTSSGKKYGYIIIPVVVPSDIEGDKVLENHPNFKVVWTVLNALRAHDDRFNAEINKTEFTKRKSSRIIFGGVGGRRNDESDGDSKTDSEGAAQAMATQLAMSFADLQNVFYAKMVTKVGTKRYWEQWAADIAKIANQHIERIEKLIEEGGSHKRAFDQLMKGLRRNINPALNEKDAIEMLSQHIITRPVFEALFENYKFAQNNPVSKSMQRMLDLLDSEAKSIEEHEQLQRFYDYVRTTVGNIDDAEGRQRIIVELYDKFFKTASPKTVEKLGIVYTPVEVVDFIVNSVAHIIKKKFDRTLSDDNVHILDPFTGTGTFITRLLQSGKISKAAMARKYGKEIHANELVLMAYYIASINIESVYHELMDEGDDYTPFDGICLTDTFQLGEEITDGEKSKEGFEEVFPQNSSRVKAQRRKPITVILGNPPYSSGQKSANDNAQNQHYPILHRSIETTYVARSNTGLNKSSYNSFVKAFRWATNRLNDSKGGVIAYVSNGSWIDAPANDGMRKSLELEFSSIYVFNLRGNQRTNGELSRKEGGKIFDSGSRNTIAITILVKRPQANQEKAKIYYHDIGDYLSKEDKLKIISNFGDISNPYMQWRTIIPNEHGDWLNARSELFRLFTPIEPEKKFAKGSKSYFNTYSNGMVTSRDSWVYNYSIHNLMKNISSMIEFYNKELDCKMGLNEVALTPTSISWSANLKSDFTRKYRHQFDKNCLCQCLYRPFSKSYVYLQRKLIERAGFNDTLFVEKNLCIGVSGIGSSKGFSAIITDMPFDFQTLMNGVIFPLYHYEEKTEQDLFDAMGDKYIRHDGVTDHILAAARKQYGRSKPITKEDIFYYVYGILHSPEYRKAFGADLKKMLPRIPLVDAKEDFWALSTAGRELAALHLNYETIEPYKGALTLYGVGGKVDYRVEKMRFAKGADKKDDKSKIYYNSQITIENIPLKAYEYIVNGKSAIEWIMERYQVTTNKDSQIKNDPNDWATEHNDEKYIYNLLLRVIALSLSTCEIVEALPVLKFEEE